MILSKPLTMLLYQRYYYKLISVLESEWEYKLCPDKYKNRFVTFVTLIF